MTQGSRQTPRGSRNAARRAAQDDSLMQAKMHLVEAQHRGDENAFASTVAAFPALAAELAEFDAALIATSGYDAVAFTPQVEQIAQRARQRGFAAVFGPATSPSLAAQAIKSLRELRQARRITQVEAAGKLGVGVDVVATLEHGGIRVTSIPERFLRMVGDLLGTTADQVRMTLMTQAAVLPALMRDTTGAQANQAHPVLDFAEVIRLSPRTSEEAKREWLAE